MSRSRASAASAAAVGLAFAGVAFGAAGGTELGRTTIVEILVTLAGAGLVAAALVTAPPGRLQGGPVVLLFGALAALTALSVTWSVAPELSFVEAGRTFSYLAAFAGAVAAARMWPRSSPALLTALLIATSAVVLYALASRIFPGTLAENELSARIGEPYGYWNAVGTTAAMAGVPALWLGSRRAVPAAARALAYPALGLAVVAILLTQSRGALAAALVGAVLWFALVPVRLRSLPVLVAGVVGAVPVSAWALSKDAFAKSLQPLAVKESVAGEFALLVLLTAVGLWLVGLAAAAAETRSLPPARFHRRIGVAIVAAVCVIPLILFTSVAFSHRGLGGTISDRWHELTSENASTPTGAGRLTAAGSSRGRYWRQAGHVFADREVAGTGAGTFAIARLRYRKDELVSRHAHGFVPQTMADLGLVGLAAALALLAAWLASAARTTGLVPRLRRRADSEARKDWHPERIALVCVTLVAVVFGVQSAIDWTWFVPGPAVMAIASAGFVVGRGPLAGLGQPAPPAPARWRERRRDPVRMAAAAAVLGTALLCGWAIWQPESSDRSSNRALELIDSGKLDQARAEAREAREANPLSPRPLIVGASVDVAAGDKGAALHALEQAALEFPGDPQTWLRLAGFQLNTLDRPDSALRTLGAALYLDPRSKVGRALFAQARDRFQAKQAAERARASRKATKRHKRPRRA